MKDSSAKQELKALSRGLLARLEDTDEMEWPARPAKSGVPASLQHPQKAATSSQPVSRLDALRQEVESCRKCPLGSHRLKAVFGVGNPSAKALFVGEGPGYQEDHMGEPFVGRAGQLLDKIIESIGLSRRTVYIANIVKCHPMINPSDPEARGNDRPPTPEEIAACRPYLDWQIRLIAPKVIVTLGSVATKTLLGEDVPISKVRGLWREYLLPGEIGHTIRLLPTYHPAALLRNPDLKRDVWTDMKNLRKMLDEEK